MSELTLLLDAARQGNQKAAGEAFGLLYEDLRRLARARLRPHQTMTLLDTTSLVHEAYLKVMGSEALPVEDRHHFFAYASRVMRSVIVDCARARQAERRGGDAEHVVLDTAAAESDRGRPRTMRCGCTRRWTRWPRPTPRLAQVVEMRYFGGLTEAEIAEALGLTERTVRRDWEKARLLLLAAMG